MEMPQKKSSAGFGPGRTLAKARQDLGLSHQEIADRLHLAPRQIVALESDDYDNLPAATYVRGYLRSYAEILGLVPAPILEAFAHMPNSAKPSSFTNIAPKEEITSRHRHVQLATYFVVAVIVALAATWWQGRVPHSPTGKVKTAPSTVPATSSTLATALTGNLVAPLPQSAPANGTQIDNAGLHSEQAPALAAQSVPAGATQKNTVAKPAPATAHVAHPGPAISSPAVSSSKAAPTVTHATASTVAKSAPAQNLLGPALPSGPRARIVLQTVQGSWVDIRDAYDNKLIYENVPAGRVITLDGNEPLSVFVGNAAGVNLQFNGKPFDITPYKRGLVARFTLGAAKPGQ